MISPGCNDGWVDHDGPFREQTIHGYFQVRHPEREPNVPADPSASLDLINGIGVHFIKDLQGSPTHIENYCSTMTICPELCRFKSKTIAIKSHQAFIIAGGERNSQFHDWMTCRYRHD